MLCGLGYYVSRAAGLSGGEIKIPPQQVIYVDCF